jgi:hypothetical protein
MVFGRDLNFSNFSSNYRGSPLAWDLSGKFDSSHCIDLDPESVYSKGESVKDPLDFDVA